MGIILDQIVAGSSAGSTDTSEQQALTGVSGNMLLAILYNLNANAFELTVNVIETGQALTQLHVTNGNVGELSVYYLINPPAGTNTVKWQDVPDSRFRYCDFIVASFKGVNSLTPFRTVVEQTSNFPSGLHATYSLSPTSSLNDLVLHIIGMNNALSSCGGDPTMAYASGENELTHSYQANSKLNFTSKAGAASNTAVSFAQSNLSALTYEQHFAFAMIPSPPVDALFFAGD